MNIKTILLFLLSVTLSNYIYADDAKYTISSDKKTITVTEDCTIPLAEFAPMTAPIYGDGEHGGVGRQKGNEIDYYQKNTRTLNPSIKGIEFKRIEGKATICITFSNLRDNQEVSFYYARLDTLKKQGEIQRDSSGQPIPDWNPDKAHTFSIRILKPNAEPTDAVASSLSLNGASLPNDIEQTLLSRTDSLAQEMGSLRAQLQKGGNAYLDWRIITGIILLLLAIFFVLYRYLQSCMKILDNENSSLSKEVCALQLELDKLKKAPQQQTKEQASASLLNNEIKEFIVSQIKALKDSAPTPIHSNSTTENVQKVKNSTKSIDTEVVKYNPSDNSFTLEESETHIFRIYSQNGTVFYTIVDDSDIRSQLGAMLQAFDGCITYQPPTSGASRIEPVNPGTLIKDGERFLVDKKLEIRFANNDWPWIS